MESDKGAGEVPSTHKFEENLPGPIYHIAIGQVGNLHVGPRLIYENKTKSSSDSKKEDYGESEENNTKIDGKQSSILHQSQSTIRQYVNIIKNAIGADTTNGLKQKLQQYYKKVILPCVGWLDKGHSLEMDKYYIDLQLDASDTLFPIEEIFVMAKTPQRILIDGQPGYGKTTLATKLAYDWATSKPYMNHFKLTFLLTARKLGKLKVDQAIIKISKCCGFNCNNMENIIKDNLSSTLLIIDGLDELDVENRMHFLELLYRQKYPEMTVIVTCRTGLFKLEDNELEELFFGAANKKEFYDLRLVVLGIGIENREKFLLNFIPQKNSHDTIKKIESITESVSDILKSPLFLILLAFIATKNDIKALNTKTELYKQFFNCIINLSNKKNDEFDLFQSHPTTETHEIIEKFGELSLNQIEKKKMEFDKSDPLTTQIYKLGFLSYEEEISCFETKGSYEAFHLSILEFAAAFYIWKDLVKNNFTNTKIKFLYDQLDKTSLIFPFLIGLLQDDVCKFFHQLLPYAHAFSASKDRLWYLLTECQSDIKLDKLLPTLIDFIPQHIYIWYKDHNKFYSSDFFYNLMNFGITEKKIKKIGTSNEICYSNLPKNVTIPHLWLDYTLCSENLQKLIQGIKCSKLTVMLDNISNKYDEVGEWNYFCQLLSIPNESYSLIIDENSICNVLLQNIDCDIVKKLHFSNFCINISNLIALKLIKKLLERNQIENLKLFYNLDQSKLQDILSTVAKSSNLHSLEMVCSNIDLRIDLYDLTNERKEIYNVLVVRNTSVVCTSELENRKCIHSLLIDIPQLTENSRCKSMKSMEGLSAIDPTVLEFDLNEFHKLADSWTGYESLEELSLCTNKSKVSSDEGIWNCLLNCKNLKMFELIFPFYESEQFDDLLLVQEIVNYLKQLPIERFSVWRVKAKHGLSKQLLQVFIHSLQKLDHVNKLKTIDLRFYLANINDFDEVKILQSVISDLMKCLKMGCLKTLNIICEDESEWNALMKSIVIDYSKFYVTHSIHGSSIDEPKIYKIRVGEFSLFDYNTFSIKLKETNTI